MDKKQIKQIFWNRVNENTQMSFGSPFKHVSAKSKPNVVTPVAKTWLRTMDDGHKVEYEANLAAKVDAAKERLENGTGTLLDLRKAEDALEIWRNIRAHGGKKITSVKDRDVRSAQARADALAGQASYAKGARTPDIDKYWSIMKSYQNADLRKRALLRGYMAAKKAKEIGRHSSDSPTSSSLFTPVFPSSPSSYVSKQNMKKQKDRDADSFYAANDVINMSRMRRAKLTKTDTLSASGEKVIFTNGKSILKAMAYFKMDTNELSHAVKLRNTVFVALSHADALGQAIKTFGKTKTGQEILATLIDTDREPIEYGYYYDNDFHLEPKNRGMVY